MIETAAGLAALDEICAVPGLAGVYVGPGRPGDLAWGTAWPTPGPAAGRSATRSQRIQATASAAGLVAGIHASDGKTGNAMAELGFRMITLASESQALRRGAAAHLADALGNDSTTATDVTGDDRRRRTRDDPKTASHWSPVLPAGRARRSSARLRADGFRVAACDLLADEVHGRRWHATRRRRRRSRCRWT